LTAQQIVYPDSTVMLRDARTGDVGFVFPKLIAIDYRNLLLKTMPLMEGQIDTLKLDIEKHKSIISDQEQEIGFLQSNLKDSQKQFDAEHSIRLACEKELKKICWWKAGTYGFAITTIVALLIKK
jgi:hypothetical protein